MDAPPSSAGIARAPGLAVLGAVVVAGLLSGVLFYRWQRGRMDAGLAAELARAPRSDEERLELWLRTCGPQVHHRLAVVGRFSPEMPWLVSHAFRAGAGPAEIWGVECAALGESLLRREGLVLAVVLPAPRRLAFAPLPGSRESRVPHFEPGAAVDGAARLAALARHLLAELPSALERDIPGARLEVRVEGP